ncbi:reverse transcriptase domain-containing protein [Tanacetum coccineum]
MGNVLILRNEAKRVTTRGGKITSEATPSKEVNETGINKNEPPRFEQDVQENPHDDDVENKSSSIPERATNPLVKPQQSSIPFLNRLRKEKEEAQQCKFLENLKQLHINIPFIEVLVQMPKYAKYLKSLLTNKSILEEACTVTMNERCSTVLLNKLPSKEKDPGSFNIPCQVSHLQINNALADLGASISLMPYTMYEKLDRFVLPIDFVILDMPKDSRILIILGRPFLAIARAMIDVFNKKITLRVGDDEELLENDQLDSFLLKDLEKSINRSDLDSCNSIRDKFFNNSDVEMSIRRIDPVNTPYSEAQETEATDRVKNEHLYSASANKIDEKKLELKDLPSHLEYAYLHGNKSFPIIISSKLSEEEKISLLHVLEKRKGAIAWKMSDIKGIRFFQISIAPEDQEKTTFTCPYGTFSYRRMSFGLCNTPATFQRCMTANFHDMVEDFMEVFMDDFSVFGNSFNFCLANLDKMLARCEETNLVLIWEKCHFMVKEGIVLGHKIYGAGIEVDRAKIDVIAKLPYPKNVKGVRSFLGHAGFYRRFIKDFSMISKPMTELLMKDVKFDFSDDCKKAFNILKEKLTTAPIIISPNWNMPFHIICDASDFAVGAVLGQRIDGKFKPIYYASKTLNNAQEHYTTTEKELLTLVFSFDKFRPYLILSKTVVYTNHPALKYLFSKQDAKPRLIRWVLLLQEFNIIIKDKKGAENLAADHLSRLENPHMEVLTEREIVNEFPDEHLMVLRFEFKDDEPWYVYFVNYIVGKEEPYAFKLCADNIMRRCVAGSETLKILAHCHSGPTGGHHSASVTAKKVYQSGFYWPSVFKDANEYVIRCDACQRSGNISSRNEMPQNNIKVCKVFDVWGLDLMGPFPDSRGNKYILVVVDYVSKWFKAQALPTNDARVVLEKALQKYGVTHKLSTVYHPQSNGQTKVTNRAIKRILERSVGYNPKDWSEKLNDALCSFRTAYKTPTGCTPFRLVYRKACHLPVEIEHKAHWALKQCNMYLTLACESRLMQLNELAELRDDAYENNRIYKEQTKKWHDSRLRGDKYFKVGNKVLLYNSRLKMYPGKLKSKWSGLNIVKRVYPYGVVEIIDRNGFSFKVNGQRLKKYYKGNIDKEDDEVIEFENGVT